MYRMRIVQKPRWMWRRCNGTQTFSSPQRQLLAQIATRYLRGAVSEFERQPFDRPPAATLQYFDAQSIRRRCRLQ